MRIVLEQQKETMLPEAVQAVRPEQYVLVRMKETADLSQESRMPRGADRRAAVWSDLVDTAKRTQVPAFEAIKELQDKGLVLAARSVPIANAIVVTAAAGSQARSAVVDALKGVAQIGSVLTHGGGYSLPNPIADKPAASQGKSSDSTPNADGIEWGVERIGAPKVWKRGIDGKGVTIGIVDSGIDVNHPSIKQHYRGTNADGSFSNDYNWIDTAGYTVGKLTPNPYDDNGHGTHVSGTSAGGVQGDAIGVAPGAKLIGAKVVFGEEMTSPISTLDA